MRSSIILFALLLSVGGSAAAAQPDKTSSVKLPSVHITTQGFAQSAQTRQMAKVANHPDEPPFMNGEPAHLRTTFDGEKLSDYTDYLQRQLLVYPLAPYSALYKGKERAAFDKTSRDLHLLLSSHASGGLKALPILPAAEAFELFHNHTHYLKFKQGSAVAFLTCYVQDEAPIKNGDYFYTVQGLTDDGKYWVSFFCPVTNPQLANSLPARAAAATIAKLGPEQFQPNLNVIDRMFESLSLDRN